MGTLKASEQRLTMQTALTQANCSSVTDLNSKRGWEGWQGQNYFRQYPLQNMAQAHLDTGGPGKALFSLYWVKNLKEKGEMFLGKGGDLVQP